MCSETPEIMPGIVDSPVFNEEFISEVSHFMLWCHLKSWKEKLQMREVFRELSYFKH